jgi:hypothetical protein
VRIWPIWPGGTSGLLCRDYKGKKADRLVTRIDPRVVSLVGDLRGHERQAAEELGQWKTHHEERKPPRLRLRIPAMPIANSRTDGDHDSEGCRSPSERSDAGPRHSAGIDHFLEAVLRKKCPTRPRAKEARN